MWKDVAGGVVELFKRLEYGELFGTGLAILLSLARYGTNHLPAISHQQQFWKAELFLGKTSCR
jgi:hypothetical protein